MAVCGSRREGKRKLSAGWVNRTAPQGLCPKTAMLHHLADWSANDVSSGPISDLGSRAAVKHWRPFPSFLDGPPDVWFIESERGSTPHKQNLADGSAMAVKGDMDYQKRATQHGTILVPKSSRHQIPKSLRSHWHRVRGSEVHHLFLFDRSPARSFDDPCVFSFISVDF